MEWVLFNPDDADPSPDLLVAVSYFQPVDSTRDADLYTLEWLHEDAPRSASDVWLLMVGHTVAAYHTASTEALELPSGATVEAMHMSFAARDAYASHRGTGSTIVAHLIQLAEAHALAYVSLDPYGRATEELWRRHGFQPSAMLASETLGEPAYRMWRRAA
jgi:GNAT superfamily N-acetyltransferase